MTEYMTNEKASPAYQPSTQIQQPSQLAQPTTQDQLQQPSPPYHGNNGQPGGYYNVPSRSASPTLPAIPWHNGQPADTLTYGGYFGSQPPQPPQQQQQTVVIQQQQTSNQGGNYWFDSLCWRRSPKHLQKWAQEMSASILERSRKPTNSNGQRRSQMDVPSKTYLLTSMGA
ncbi:hypothetical protein BD410DRAFT_808349 [Rickenella mellea]|uniref:Uncharacterized protein n=1 Tax=Rickenella mellea TaxID=50990 RepID=A0A4Y7PLQ1_9AGAM|nr:hypothetical protein BD410DRAFT_808349 [Rickenella mellea]